MGLSMELRASGDHKVAVPEDPNIKESSGAGWNGPAVRPVTLTAARRVN